SRLLRRGEERPHVIDVEDALLDERIDRLGELLIDHRRKRADRLSDEPGAIVAERRGKGVRREVRHGDVDRRDRPRAGDQPKLPELFGRLETVPALDLNGRGPELGRVADAPLEQREERLVRRLAGRADGGVDPAGGGTDPRTLLPQRRQRQQPCAVEDEVHLRHSRKWVSITRSRVKPSSRNASAATARTASRGMRPMSSPRSRFTPAAFARDSTSRHTRASDVVVKSRRFIETCARGGSVSMKPFAWTAG